jgi:hypothetical protein
MCGAKSNPTLRTYDDNSQRTTTYVEGLVELGLLKFSFTYQANTETLVRRRVCLGHAAPIPSRVAAVGSFFFAHTCCLPCRLDMQSKSST